MKIEILYHETDCGKPCTPNGCAGHATDIPVGIEIEGVRFYVEGYENLSYPDEPNKDLSVGKVRKALDKLQSDLLKDVRWECDLCTYHNEDGPCVLSYNNDQNIIATLCPFDNRNPNWRKIKP